MVSRVLASALVLVFALCGLLATACSDEDPKLKVSSLAPAKGSTDGGTYVVIKGNRFIKDGPRNAKVYFGSRQGTVVRFQSDSELVVQAPGGKSDETVDVLVIFDPGGQLKLQQAFKFVDKDDRGPTMEDLTPKDTGKKKPAPAEKQP